MDNRVEKVARAISTKTYAVIDGSEDCGAWEEMSDRARETYLEAAKAAIAALTTKSEVGPIDDEIGRAKRWRQFPNGDAGDALDWSLDHLDDAFERTDFLERWREGDVGEWPEYLKWVQLQRSCATAPSASLNTQEKAE